MSKKIVYVTISGSMTIDYLLGSIRKKGWFDRCGNKVLPVKTIEKNFKPPGLENIQVIMKMLIILTACIMADTELLGCCRYYFYYVFMTCLPGSVKSFHYIPYDLRALLGK